MQKVQLPDDGEGLAWIACQDPAELMLYPGLQAASVMAAASGYQPALAYLRFMAQHMHTAGSVVSSGLEENFCQAAAIASDDLDVEDFRQQFQDWDDGSSTPDLQLRDQFVRQHEALEARKAATKNMLEQAAREGRLAALQWLRAPCQTRQLESGLAKAAAEAGQLHILQYLEVEGREGSWGTDVMCASLPHPDCFRYLISNFCGGRLPSQVYPALISAGDKDMLRWLMTSCPASILSKDKRAMEAAVESGDVEMLILLKSPMLRHDLTYHAMKIAAGKGELGMVQWMRSHQDPWPWDQQVLAAAVKSGSMPLLRFMCSAGCPWGLEICAAAVEHRQTAMLQWLRSQTPPCPWDSKCSEQAARNGDLDVMKWLREQEPPAPWNALCTEAAAANGHLEILQYMRSQPDPCPLRSMAFSSALRGTGDLQVLNWLHQEGFSLDRDLYFEALRGQQRHTLQWLQHDCPLPYELDHPANKAVPDPVIMFLGDIGISLSGRAAQLLKAARRKHCTFHGLMRWCLRAVGDPSRAAAAAFDYMAPNSQKQTFLVRLAMLPPELISKIAVMAGLQHDMLS